MNQRRLFRHKRRIGILCCIAAVIILAGTLWPYNPFPPNRVEWLVGPKGIEFRRAGVVVSDKPLKVQTSDSNQSCSLELLVRPAGMQFEKTILSFYAKDNQRQFQLEQVDKALGVSREFVDALGKHNVSRFGVDGVFSEGELVLITITSGPHGTTVYKNGSQADHLSWVRISLEDLSGQIVLGTSPVDYDPWEGIIRELATYAKELTPEEALRHYLNWTSARDAGTPDLNGAIACYAFAEGMGSAIRNAVIAGPNLHIPKMFRQPDKPLLESPFKEFELTRRYLRSLLLNIVMFVPLGYLFCAYGTLNHESRQAVLRAIVAAGIFSLMIEVLQAYIPMRFSGLTDVLTNTLGGSLGALAFLTQRRWFAQRRPQLN